MLKILFRQIFKQWRGLLPVVIIWIIAGYLIFTDRQHILTLFRPADPAKQISFLNKHWFFRKITYYFSDTPEPGKQDPEQAYYDYYLPARDIITQQAGFMCTIGSFVGLCDTDDGTGKIRLDLMANACSRIPPDAIRRDYDFRPHWLEKIRNWNLQTNKDGRQLVEPDEYWEENRDQVLSALEKSVQAMNYAYEIPTTVHQEANTPTLLVPEFISEISRAVCMEEVGILAWGDYVRFQEVRAFRKIEEETVENLADRYIYPAERSLLILNSLQNSYEYIRALKEYSGGIVPDPHQPVSCRNNFLLACYSPEEARDIFNRMLYYSSERERPSIYLNLGRIHISLYQKYGADHMERALDFFSGAAKSFDTEREARFSITKIYLKTKEFQKAHEQLTQLSLIMKNRGGEDMEFRKLARLTLMELGRFKDADCYADLSELSFGKRPHCENPPY